MDPPLLPSVLNHMDSFQAAMQISQPLTDQAWHVLRPRLLAQLPFAERREKERVQQNELLAEEYRQRRQQEAQLKETKETLDREWETYQAPVRTKIGSLADEIIETRWAQGKSVTKETSPKFAADVLLHVRQRFYSEIAREDEATLSAGESVRTDLPNGPPTRKLILENMKWLFDTKIKPRTDHFQKELFLCSACDGNFKFYGFEGVIQHYAAKHTTLLSMGNIVVHWRAEWPENPPFNPNPSAAKAAYYKVPTPAVPPIQDIPVQETHIMTSCENYEGDSTPVATRQYNNIQQTSKSYDNPYVALHQKVAHPGFSSQPFAAPSVGREVEPKYPGAQSGYVGAHSSFPFEQHGQQAQPYNLSFQHQQAHDAFNQSQPNSVSQSQVADPLRSIPAAYPLHHPLHQPTFSNGSLTNHTTSSDFSRNASGQVSDLYQRQMDEMAKHAKDVFTGIGGIKDLPGSVRIYVVIQHTISRFKTTFPNEPSLSMFIDGLDHNAVMRPVRSVNGLGCKTCIKTGTGAKLYTLPHLVNHFRTIHVEALQSLGHSQYGFQGSELDWKSDMIDLPDTLKISNLVNASGMTDSKLGLIAWAFPGAFPSPLPRLRGVGNSGPLPTYKRELDVSARGFHDAPPNVADDSSHTFQRQTHVEPYIRPLSPASSSEPLEPPGDDEYDPHRPAYLGKLVKIESNSHPAFEIDQPARQADRLDSSLQPQYERPQQIILSDRVPEQSFHVTSPIRTQVGDQRFQQHYEVSGHPGLSYSTKTQPMSRPGYHPEWHAHNQAKSMDPVFSNGPDALADLDKTQGPTQDGGRVTDDRRPPKYPSGSASPIRDVDAAERFLSNLTPEGTNQRSEMLLANHERGNRSTALWRKEHIGKRKQQHFGEDGAHEQRSGNISIADRIGLKSDVPLQQLRPVLSEPIHGAQAIGSQRTEPHSQYREDNRPPSHLQTPFQIARADEVLPAAYNPYGDARQAVLQDSEGQTENFTEGSRSQLRPYPASRFSDFRNRSRSPLVAEGTALYRTRSPIEENRQNSIIRVHSPSLRRDFRSQRALSYSYPMQNGYEIVDDANLSEDRFPQRIEYFPSRYEDHEPARYVVARHPEHISPNYEPYEQGYVEEPLYEHYERNGQVYRIPQRVYEEGQSRAASQSYRY